MKTVLALLFIASTALATPVHESPKWYVATVNGRDAVNEHYGPFRSRAAAGKFCMQIPAPVYRCTVEPVLPRAEWLRKGAR